MALYSPTTSPSAQGDSPLSFMIFSFAKFQDLFVLIKPSISKPFNSHRYFFLVTLFFFHSILEFFPSLAGTLPSSSIWNLFTILPNSLLPIGSSMQQFISIFCTTNSSYEIMSSQMAPSPFFRTIIWQEFFVLCIFLASSCICFLLRISCMDTCPLPRTTLFDASFLYSSCQQNSTFLSTLA